MRFFALKNVRRRFKHEVSDFLTEYMEKVSDPLDDEPFAYDTERLIFCQTFNVLSQSLGDYAFSFANKAKTDLSAGFSIYHYEAITIGLQAVLDGLNPADQAQMTKLGEELKAIKLNAEFMRITSGGGKNSPGPLNERIGFVEERLTSAFG